MEPRHQLNALDQSLLFILSRIWDNRHLFMVKPWVFRVLLSRVPCESRASLEMPKPGVVYGE